jgi:hypothetical protein
MLIKVLARPSFINLGKKASLSSLRTDQTFFGLRFINLGCAFWSNNNLPKWGSKTKKEKRKVPLHRTIEMSLSPEQEVILAPLRAKVKEQVNSSIFLFENCSL